MAEGKKLKVQYGCGLSCPVGWENFDSTPSLFVSRLPFAKHIASILKKIAPSRRSYLLLNNISEIKAKYGDVVKGLPLADCSVDLLYASHVLEHLPVQRFRAALLESFRVMKKGALFRLVVPNLQYYVEAYIASDSKQRSIEFCLNTDLGLSDFPNLFSRVRFDSHHVMFDRLTLKNELQRAGFAEIRDAVYGDSDDIDFNEVEDEKRWSFPETIGFQCKKPFD